MSRPTLSSAARALRRLAPGSPRLGIILGSGFGVVTEAVRERVEIPFERLPGFPRPTVPGHAGKLVWGELGGAEVLLLAGRVHFYEGHSMADVTFATRALAGYGITSLLLTNAAGGINRRFRPGDLMAVTDHINLMGVNPLRPASTGSPPAFVDLSHVYDADLLRDLKRAARLEKTLLRAGVYVAVSGPTYETPAEIRAFARIGADAVGMSTVPEAIVARQSGLRVAALSCITNFAAGRSPGPITHEEVLAQGRQAGQVASRLIQRFAKLVADAPVD